MEILSPAGNMDSVYAAVRTGADAVYLGLKDFSARRNAENFSAPELLEAIKYCHKSGVKVYVAINTMIKENELPAAVKAANEAFNLGADAFIVSDIGFISALRRVLPEAVLHASTQMTVHSPAALKALKALGIRRVVLAREMSREEIKNFCAAAKKEDIEVEVFVHGALCMCVSGQCLMSSVLGGRSGNRGLCAGPCRLEFSSSGTGRHDLSLKDLSLIDYLGELAGMGVASAKIEGRMKRPEYVAAATAACRAALDGTRDPALNTAIRDVFSRSGFTDGYYTRRLGADMFGIRTKEDVLSADSAFSYIHFLYRGERQRVPVKISAVIKPMEDTVLSISDNDGNFVTVTGAPAQAARVKATDTDDIRLSLSKLGGTPYYAEEIKLNAGEGLFIAAAELNRLRREAVAALDLRREGECRSFNAEYKVNPDKKETGTKTPLIYAMFKDKSGMPEDLTGIAGVILPASSDFKILPDNITKIAALPRYITDENALKERLCSLKAEGVLSAYCGNLAAIELARQAGLSVIASNGLNCANSESLSSLAALGASKTVISAEVNITAAKHLNGKTDTGIFAYGRLPLMLTRNCPVKNTKTCRECGKTGALKDRMGIVFPVACNKDYAEVLNSAPLYLADKREDLKSFDFLLLSFTDETQSEARRIVDSYLSGAAPEGTFTRGLYYKNII